MSDVNVKVIIPFRMREGGDARRTANLEVVLAWWWAHGYSPSVVSDGLKGSSQFNRHRAYNRAVATHPEVDVFIFAEADMLVPVAQIDKAVTMASTRTGLVVPFTEYRYLSDRTTAHIRDTFHDMSEALLAEWWGLPARNTNSLFTMNAESTMSNGKSIGAVNVVSRGTILIAGGFTEATSGNWYDDNIIEEGFSYLTQKTRWVKGPAAHLYHLPGTSGDHVTEADKKATAHNKALLKKMRDDIRTGDRLAVRTLLSARIPTNTRSTS